MGIYAPWTYCLSVIMNANWTRTWIELSNPCAAIRPKIVDFFQVGRIDGKLYTKYFGANKVLKFDSETRWMPHAKIDNTLFNSYNNIFTINYQKYRSTRRNKKGRSTTCQKINGKTLRRYWMTVLGAINKTCINLENDTVATEDAITILTSLTDLISSAWIRSVRIGC